MAKKKQKKIEDIKDRNSFFTAMMKRHPCKQLHKSVKRTKDAKNHWSKDWE